MVNRSEAMLALNLEPLLSIITHVATAATEGLLLEYTKRVCCVVSLVELISMRNQQNKKPSETNTKTQTHKHLVNIQND